MNDYQQDDAERIKRLMAEAVANDVNRLRSIHEAGHAVVALHLGLPLESANIEEREDSDGEKFGCVKVRPISESFSAKELQEHSAAVIERVRNQIIMLLAGETATRVILERAKDPLAQHDQSQIRGLLREFTELQDVATIESLVDAARQVVGTRRTHIETLAAALVKRGSLNANQVRQVVGN